VWQRPSELDGQAEEQFLHSIVAPSRFVLVPQERVLLDDERLWLRRNGLHYPPREEERWVSLVAGNEHLLGSAFMRAVVSHLSALQRPGGGESAHHQRPWELIFPQGEDGIPT